MLAVAALVWLDLVLIQPNHPNALGWRALLLVPLELPALVLALLALGRTRAGQVLRLVAVAALTLIVVLKVADFAMFTALGRGFNPVADLSLIDAGLRLIGGTLGWAAAVGAAFGAALLTAVIASLLWAAMGVWMRLAPRRMAFRGAAGAAACVAAGVAVGDVGHNMGYWRLPTNPPGAAFTARVGVERYKTVRQTLADLRAFQVAAANDPFAEREALFDRIDRDVLIVFVESYGRTSLDTPFYAEMHLPTLERAQDRLEQAGLVVRSGLLASPTRGGQSWLAHETLAYGLWLDSQVRYLAALASERQSLFHLAAAAGFDTAAVAPAITMDWPEAQAIGFDRVLAADDLGYAGKPFNWVTMPDQFTLAALDRLLRQPGRERRLFANVSLISSHAPWVPVPSLVPWEDLGDGRIFDDVATSGDPPEVVWRDRDRVRLQYRMAVDYALSAVFDYVMQHADDPPLILVLGDHQAAGFIALDERPDVPIHVIGPPTLVAYTDDWGWTEGLIPANDLDPIPMDRMRGMVLRAFSSGIATSEERS